MRVVNCDKKTEVKGNFQILVKVIRKRYLPLTDMGEPGGGAGLGGVTRSFILCDLG